MHFFQRYFKECNFNRKLFNKFNFDQNERKNKNKNFFSWQIAN